MYSNLYQWRRIRKRVMLSRESKRRVAASEGISRATLRKMLAFETPPRYWRRNPTIPDARPLPLSGGPLIWGSEPARAAGGFNISQ